MLKPESTSKRIIALLLSVLMLLSVMPTSTLVAAEENKGVTVTVKDSDKNAIEGATVTYTYTYTYTAESNEQGTENSEESTGTTSKTVETTTETDENGKAVINLTPNDAKITKLTVSANNYNKFEQASCEYKNGDTVNVTLYMKDPELEFNKGVVSTIYSNDKRYFGDNGSKTYDFSATTESGSTIAYSVSVNGENVNEGDVSISSDGQLTVKKDAEGTVTITAQVERDTEKYYEPKTIKTTVNLKKDTTAPGGLEFAFKADYNKDSTLADKKEVTVTLSAKDDETGIASYSYSTDGGVNWTEIEKGDNSFTISKDIEMAKDQLQAKAVDNAGNASTIEDAQGRAIIIDKSVPGIAETYTLGGDATFADSALYVKDSITVAFEITDDSKVVDTNKKPTLQLNGETETITWDWDSVSKKFTGSFTCDTDGKYTFEVKYSDFVGNEKTTTGTVGIDNTAPTISEITGNPTEWSKSATLTVGATDAGVGIAQYSFDGGNNWQDSKEYKVESNGTYSVMVKDNLGNTTINATEVEVRYLDTDAPTMSVTAAIPNWTSSDVTITGTVNDITSSVSKVYYSTDGENWHELTSSENITIQYDKDNEKAITGFTMKVSTEGKTTYQFKCEDAAGNGSSESSVTVQIDKTAPVVSLESDDNWHNSAYTINGTVTDTSGISKIYYRLSGSNAAWSKIEKANTGDDFKFNVTKPENSGEYTYEVYAVDEAGNSSENNPAKVPVKFDVTAPTISNIKLYADGKEINEGVWTNEEVIVTFSATDVDSGINGVYCYYYENNDANKITVNVTCTNKDNGSYEFKMPNTADNINTYHIYAKDDVGNTSSETTVTANIDVTPPIDLTIKYSKPASAVLAETLSFGIFKADVTATITASDDLSGVKEIEYSFTNSKGEKESKTATAVDGKITVDIPKGDKIQLTAVAIDNVGNRSDSKSKNTDSDNRELDEIAAIGTPKIKELTVDPVSWTNGDVVITGTVSIADVVYEDIAVTYITVQKKGGTEQKVTAADIGKFDAETSTFTFTYTVSSQNYKGDYDFTAGNNVGESAKVSCSVYMDKEKPEITEVTANPSDWTNGDVSIKVKFTDNLSGVKAVYWKIGNDEKSASDISGNEYLITIGKQDYEGFVYVWCVDNAGNESEKQSVGVKMDKTSPVVKSASANPSNWTNGDVVITGEVEDPSENNVSSGIASISFKNTDGSTTTVNKTTENIDETGNYLDANGKYQIIIKATDYAGDIEISCTDFAGNKSEKKSVSIYMDVTSPSVLTASASPSEWTNGNVVITGSVSDTDVNGVHSGIASMSYKDTDGTVKNVKKGEETANAKLNDDYSFEIVINATDYEGDIEISCTDVAGNKSEKKSVSVKMDVTSPSDLKITYDQNVVATVLESLTFGFFKAEKVTAKIEATDNHSLDYIKWEYSGTDAKYGKTNIKMSGETPVEKITGDDITEGYITVEIPAQFRGEFKAKAVDKAGNESEWINEGSGKSETSNTTSDSDIITGLVIDTISPSCVMYYSEPANEYNNILYYQKNPVATIKITEANFYSDDVEIRVNGEKAKLTTDWVSNGDVWTGKIDLGTDDGEYIVTVSYCDRSGNKMETYKSKKIVIDGTNPTCEVTYNNSNTYKDTLYFKNEPVATIKITEANFYSDDVEIRVNGEEAKLTTDWVSNGDVWTGKLNIGNTENEIYKVTVSCTDLSGNKMDTYKSPSIIYDKNAPVISVEYTNKNVKNLIAGREYYNEAQTAIISIVDANFCSDSDYVSIKISAKDANGNNVNGAYSVGDWIDNGSNHTLPIKYSGDANYTFDISCEDLAKNAAETYSTDKFTVDKAAPTAVSVEYDKNALKNTKSGVKYYNAPVTVTLTAKDDTSGIYKFDYSYIKGSGVSRVNAQLLKQAIEDAKITHTGKTATATFTIPKSVLTVATQFNGTVEVVAYDRAGWSSEKHDDTQIVVDNIKPTATVTFNKPTQTIGDVSYYAGNIVSTIVINEANFFSEDVNVVVTKDKKNYPVTVKWTNNSVDVHTGTFTLTGDGDYVVSVTYKDRSTNEMTPFKSNQLTIDTSAPVIIVSNVRHQSANNKETISLTVSVRDTNITSNNIKPVLNVVEKKDNGNNVYTYETKTVSLGKPETRNDETVFIYTIRNLEVDGYYTLSCSATDNAGHRVTTINSTGDNGSNVTSNTVNFSVNREGSVFWLETEHNDKYTGEVFTDELNGAYINDEVTIKLHELNVDKVDENKDKDKNKDKSRDTIFILNDGSESKDIILVENENYSKNVIVGKGGWYETIYTLSNSDFDHDGIYSFNVISYDKAGNSNINTKDETGIISFTLDRTNPVISANVRSNQRKKANQFWVEFEIAEVNLDVNTVEVKLTDKNGNIVETEIENLGNNRYRFLIENGYNYSFIVNAADLAGNEADVLRVEHFTVSTNIFVLWYANKPLFWGTIGGVILLTSFFFIIIYKKKRKEEE